MNYSIEALHDRTRSSLGISARKRKTIAVQMGSPQAHVYLQNTDLADPGL